MKTLETTKLIEITMLVAVDTYDGNFVGVSAMDYITTASEAQVIGYTERTVIASYMDGAE
jgi:hypothetical protein